MTIMDMLKAAAFVLLFACIAFASADEETLSGNWVLTVGEDPLSFETVASLQQASSTSIKDEYATKDVVPRLEFRCVPGNPTVLARIDWGRFISSFNTELGFKVDDGKRTWLKWGVDRTEKITISRSGDDTQKLVEQLKLGTQLEVEISPYSEGPVAANFDLASLADALQKLQDACE